MTEIFKTPRSFGLVAISLLVDLDHLNHLCSTTQTSPTMPEISVEERRRRRQEKIRAGAADRLAKITEGNKEERVKSLHFRPLALRQQPRIPHMLCL